MWDQSQSDVKRRPKPGILRLDISKPRRSSGGSVEFKVQPEFLGEVASATPPASTGATSPPQLSVTWASVGDGDELDPRIDSNKTRMSQMHSQLKASLDQVKKLQAFEESINEITSGANTPHEGNNSEDDDYSASVSAIMQRRASIRPNRKKSFRTSTRTSSPMDVLATIPDRRRSSVYTSSSGEPIFSTAASVEEGANQDSTQEQIFENIRLHKEVLQSVKFQPWSMKRKLKLVRQAKAYIAKHQGVLQERFAMSRSTRDLWARFKIMINAKCQHWRRSLGDFSAVLIPWETQIKQIESHFGSVVASYFTFLRWLLWVNIVITAMLSTFVIVPEWMAQDKNVKDERKTPLKGELKIAGNFMTIWEFNGYLKYSPLFYGYYSNFSGAVRWGYNLPLAYFLTSLVVYIYSFVATLRKMAENSRSSKLSTKDDECVFSWKLFSAWDYMIGHAETAHNRVASVVLGFKEALLEEAEKRKDKHNWKVILLRIIVNFLVLGLLGASAYTIIIVVDRSENVSDTASWWRRNEITIVINVISLILPMVFEVLGLLESFHPRGQLRLQLGRIMVLNLLNLYSLIFALFFKITEKTDRLEQLRYVIANATNERRMLQSTLQSMDAPPLTSPISMNLIANYSSNQNSSLGSVLGDFTTMATEVVTRCYTIVVNCSKTKSSTSTLLTTTLLLFNLTSTMVPDEWQNETEKSPYEYLSSTMQTTSTTEDLSYYYDYGENETYYYTEEERAARRGRAIADGNAYGNDSSGGGINTSSGYNIPQNWTAFNTNDTDFFENGNLTIFPPYFNESDFTNSSESSTESSSEDPQMKDFYSDYIYDQDETENCTKIVCEVVNDTVATTDDVFSTTEEVRTTEEQITQTPESTSQSSTEQSTTATETSLSTTTVIPTTPIPKEVIQEAIRNVTRRLRDARKILTGLCWETMLGQEMAKILVTDLVTVIGMSLFQDFFRALFVRFMNRCWIWDLEKKFPQYGDFKVAENVLQLVCNQGQVWMGIFFSPGLAVLNLAKLIILMYVRLWIIFTCNVPHEIVFRATRSNNFYLSLLLTMLFLCVLPVGYAIVWLTPSWHCGPFSNSSRISEFFTNTTRSALPKSLHKPLEYATSSSTVIPLLLLLILIIYYLVSLTGALREANQDLRDQLQKERAEERKKMCKVTVEAEKAAETANSIATRWRKVLEASSPLSPTIPPILDTEETKIQAKKDLLARIIKKAKRKESATSDDESGGHHHVQNDDDEETDTEHHDPLPHDKGHHKNGNKVPAQPTRKERRQSLIDIVQILRRDSINEPHPIGRFRVDRAIVDAPDHDPDANSKVVAERRNALLKRQKQFVRTDSTTLPDKEGDTGVNCEVVNEKTNQAEKKTKRKSLPKPDPDLFKLVDRISEEHTENGRKESPPKDQNSKKKKTSPPEKIKANRIPDPPPMPKSPVIPPKGRRKFGSFLALVKDAVNTKRLEAEKKEQCDTPDIPSPFSTFEEPIEESIRILTQEGLPQTSSSSQSGSSSKTRMETGRKRQDSQGSVWSEHIPVITISKSNSEECILQNSGKDAVPPKTSPERRANEEKD